MSDLIGSASDLVETSGPTFLHKALQFLRSRIDAEIIVIGSVRPAENERIKIHCWYHALVEEQLEEYDACALPCFKVVNQGHSVVFTKDVAKQYPDHPIIQELGIEGYVGVPLISRSGTVIGLVNCEWLRVIEDEEARQAQEAFELLSQRLAEEILAIQAQEAMALVADDALYADSENPFRDLMNTVCGALMVRTAFVAKCHDKQSDTFTVLAFSRDGESVVDVENRNLNYGATPCGKLLEQDSYIVSSGLLEAYPDVRGFVERGTISYFGVTIRDGLGVVIGHLALMHDREIPARLADTPLFQMLFARVRSDLQKYQAEQASKALENMVFMKRKNESLGLLAGTVAHDLNNILSTMTANMELGLGQLTADHPARRYLDVLDQSIDSSQQIVRNLLEFASSGISDHKETGSLSDIVTATLQLVSTARKPDRRIRNEISDDPPPVTMDRAQIGQLIMNLVLNALDATQENGGTVQVRTGVTRIDTKDRMEMVLCHENLPDDCVYLEVEDDGIGMDQDTLSSVFDPYFTTKPQGRGLGLASAIGILQRHNAGLSVTSAPGAGTTFRVLFPPTDAVFDTSEQAAKQGGDAPCRKSGYILVVDDDTGVKSAVVNYLEDLGYPAIGADGCEEAHSVVDSVEDIWGALIDLQMPGKDGWQTLQELRARLPGLKAMMMSGGVDRLSRSPHHDPSVYLLRKPFRRVQLAKSMETLEGNP